MKRAMIKIIEEKCDGCGNCVTSCAEGAIAIVDGKAKVVSDSYCDGLGACLSDCPQDALVIEEREADPFDQAAVDRHLAADCAAFAHSAFHGDLLKDRPFAIACPKLDDPERNVERLTALIAGAGLKSVHILRMEVPCCGGLQMMTRMAMERAGVEIPITSEVVPIGPAFGSGIPMGGGCPGSAHSS